MQFKKNMWSTKKRSELSQAKKAGVGKNTLIKGMRRNYWFGKTTPAPKTDGDEISSLILEEIQSKVYDLAGDAEYLNKHALFLSSSCLHFTV